MIRVTSRRLARRVRPDKPGAAPGSLPLVFATGAGAASRNSMGTTVVGGMLAVTVIGVLLVPAFYVAVEQLAEWRRRPIATPAAPRGDAGEVPGR
jgi:Cu/Ag efflux pump CusA